MKLGYSNGLLHESLEVTCARAAGAGYDGLECLFDECALGEPERIQRLLDEHGLELAAGAALLSDERELIHLDAGVRAAAVDYLCAAVELAADLGAGVLTVAPAADGRLTPRAAVELEWAWCVEGLQAAQEVGDRRGVRIGIEPVCRFETYFVTQADQALTLAEEVGPGCGVVLDVFHMYLEERDPLAAIARASDRLVNFHLAEHNRLAPGCGVVPWPEVLEALRESGYRSYLTLECLLPASAALDAGQDATVAAAALLRSLA